jgi:broad-specificity NMP kinase
MTKPPGKLQVIIKGKPGAGKTTLAHALRNLYLKIGCEVFVKEQKKGVVVIINP